MTHSKLIEHSIIIDNKRARYYQIQTPLTDADKPDTDKPSADKPDINNPSSNKPTAHFYGGNGFAVGCYTTLLAELSEQFDMVSLSMRGGWHDKPTANKLTREDDADILIQFIEQTQSQPIIGIGHSQGATSTALACAKRPDLFSALYLIEPVTFTRQQVRLYNVLPRWLLNRYEPFKSCLTKQGKWQSVDEYYDFLRQKNAFKRLSDENLRIYVNNSLEVTEDGLALTFPPEQELANYFGVPFIDDALLTMNANNTPYTLIIGKPTIFISKAVRNEWRTFVAQENISICHDYGHLLPVEAPEICSKLIIDAFKGT